MFFATKEQEQEYLYNSFFHCRVCDVRLRKIDGELVSPRDVPSSAAGLYCKQCAPEVQTKFKRSCHLCRSPYIARFEGQITMACPSCTTPAIRIETRRLQHNLERAEDAGLPATLRLDEWLETLDHFDRRCAYCGGDFEVLEHFVPISKSGGTTKDNCLPACGACNTRKIHDGNTIANADRARSYLEGNSN